MEVRIWDWEDHWASENKERRVGEEGLWLFSAVDWWIIDQNSIINGSCSKDNSEHIVDSV